MILADTSVWIDHLKKGLPTLVAMLDEGQVLMHPLVLGELACGNLGDRRNALRFLAFFPVIPSATDSEALDFIERRALMGRGIGYIDVHLLASVALASPARLWTLDRRLAGVAGELGLVFR